MKYFEIDFTLTPCTQDAQDILSALAGEAGCESFEETPTGLKAYIQQQLYDEEALQVAIESFPFEDIHIIYNVREAEDRDWNEQWEQEGFEPIVVAPTLIIHDGRHLPPKLSSPLTSPLLAIEIDAHLAFGTGTHETTRMICRQLLGMDLQGKRVLDCGCGTGILGICALKLGAASCVGYDIDEWSTDNTRHNAVINHVDDCLTALCGDSAVLSDYAAEFDLVLANINRNILLADMPHFVKVMTPDAILILSGFYQDDCALLASKAQSLGLTHLRTVTDQEWACMVFINNSVSSANA
jgi:ribosomal protein L11 methyltransferase